jgi:hypothetical protein
MRENRSSNGSFALFAEAMIEIIRIVSLLDATGSKASGSIKTTTRSVQGKEREAYFTHDTKMRFPWDRERTVPLSQDSVGHTAQDVIEAGKKIIRAGSFIP